MPDIFLSYCREDQAIARRFAEGLEQEGFDVWWDQALNAGESFDQVTERTLKEARAVVVLWTRRSVQSRWVRSEATLADRYGTLVPVMLEPCDRPIMFELTHTADLAGWSGDAGRHALAVLRRRPAASGVRRRACHAASIPAPRAASPSLRSRRTPLRLAASGAAGVVLAAGLAWWLVRDRRPMAPPRPAPRPHATSARNSATSPAACRILPQGSGPAGMYRLTDFEGVEEQAAISPDGTLVAFISDRDGHERRLDHARRHQRVPQPHAGAEHPAVQSRDPRDGLFARWIADPVHRRDQARGTRRQRVERAGAGRCGASAGGRRRRVRVVTRRQLVRVSHQ